MLGITDWHRDGTLAEYAAVEARNLAPLPGNVEFAVGASLPISGLTAWQGLFQHGRLQAGQSVLAHGAAGAVGSLVTQLAREFGAYVIGGDVQRRSTSIIRPGGTLVSVVGPAEFRPRSGGGGDSAQARQIFRHLVGSVASASSRSGRRRGNRPRPEVSRSRWTGRTRGRPAVEPH